MAHQPRSTGFKASLRSVLPAAWWESLSRGKRSVVRPLLKRLVLRNGWITSCFTAKELNEFGLNVSLLEDYFSPLPTASGLEKTRERWFKPSELVGVRWDLDEMKKTLEKLTSEYAAECAALPAYEEIRNRGYGEGFTPLDALVLYWVIRDTRPKRYLEVGAGISTYYCSLAAKRNAQSGAPLRITTIDPDCRELLETIQGIAILRKQVQEVELAAFEQLEAGDVLFIDSTHIVKIDGDVPYLFLEVLPRLKKGVLVQIHDIPFPYNVPCPPEIWIFGRDWPVFWTEAMLLQALLCHSSAFQIKLSLPLLRHFDENFLRARIPNYERLAKVQHDTYSSLWIEKVQ